MAKSGLNSKKWEALGAMYQHGSDPEVLKNYFPDMDIKQIRTFVKSFKLRAQKKIKESRALNKCDDAPIELWYEYIQNCHAVEGTTNKKKKRKTDIDMPANDYSFLLSKSMMYAAYFEDHYRSNNPDEPNYSEIYRYLSQILAGVEPTQLRPGNAAKVMEMFGRMKEIINDKDSIQRYLTYMKDNHKVSSLKTKTPLTVAEEKRTNLPLNVAEEYEKYKEFLSSYNTTDAELEDINRKSSSFIVNRENSILKLSLKQRACASALSYIPGLNPLEVVPQSLVKPPIAIIAPRKSKKRSRGTD